MRDVRELKDGWRFCLTEPGTEEMPSFEAPVWQEVSVPHDWAIYGEFSPENDPQPLESSVLDYHEGMIQIGRTGGLPFIGTGWYVTDLDLSGEYDCFFLEFDGIMNHSKVRVNGIQAAERPFGYSSFCVDLTPYAGTGRRVQVVVKVDSIDKTSRWYPGAGIFRPVRLVSCAKIHFAYCGIRVQSDYDREARRAVLNVECDLQGPAAAGKEDSEEKPRIQVMHRVFDPSGMSVTQMEGWGASCMLEDPALWDVEDPKLYCLISEILVDGKPEDRVCTRFGIRTAEFTSGRGFFLNGRNLKIQGVCMHHDLGMLGAAYREDVWRKRFRALKKMGCNALRTSHNPPCPKTLDICDDLGILVLDECFDEWHEPKAVNGYANEFDSWAERDLTDMIRRDRNHPCVILYSIGNEIPEQTRPDGRDTCRWLREICRREDPTRLVTNGFNRPERALENGMINEVDVVGLNYCPSRYGQYHREFPHWKLLATETVSAVSSRGEYYFPVREEMPAVKRANLHVNSFDMSAAACAYYPDIEFEAQKKSPFVAGQFVWTGFDYLGEPTPYREEWPSRSSYFGIFDLAGLKKDRYYAYAAQWQKEPVLHIFPHWNWEEGQEVEVHCYTNLDRVRLWLNSRELVDQIRKDHRIIFPNLRFEAGELHAVGYRIEDRREIPVAEETVRTAGAPSGFVLTKDEEYLTAACRDVCFVEADIVDACGTLCPNADNRVEIEVSGAGEYVASDAGDQTSLRRFNEPWCRAFHGKLVIALRAKDGPGDAFVRVSAAGIGSACMRIEVR